MQSTTCTLFSSLSSALIHIGLFSPEIWRKKLCYTLILSVRSKYSTNNQNWKMNFIIFHSPVTLKKGNGYENPFE